MWPIGRSRLMDAPWVISTIFFLKTAATRGCCKEATHYFDHVLAV